MTFVRESREKEKYIEDWNGKWEWKSVELEGFRTAGASRL